MSLSALAKRMADAGAPIEAIIMAMEAVEAEQARVQEGRAKAAERKRRQRNRERDGSVTVTGQSRDEGRDPSLSLPPNEKISNPPTHTHPDNNPARESRAAKPKPIAKPDDVSEQTWADFVRHRKAKRAPVSETALAGIRREAGKAGWSMEAALVEAIARGWQGFNAEWVDKPKSAANDSSFLASLGSGP